LGTMQGGKGLERKKKVAGGPNGGTKIKQWSSKEEKARREQSPKRYGKRGGRREEPRVSQWTVPERRVGSNTNSPKREVGKKRVRGWYHLENRQFLVWHREKKTTKEGGGGKRKRTTLANHKECREGDQERRPFSPAGGLSGKLVHFSTVS